MLLGVISLSGFLIHLNEAYFFRLWRSKPQWLPEKNAAKKGKTCSALEETQPYVMLQQPVMQRSCLPAVLFLLIDTPAAWQPCRILLDHLIWSDKALVYRYSKQGFECHLHYATNNGQLVIECQLDNQSVCLWFSSLSDNISRWHFYVIRSMSVMTALHVKMSVCSYTFVYVKRHTYKEINNFEYYSVYISET